ncbi:hypothetical protein COA01_23285 [Bacillus cereus]|uniref:hypothetical protein n=1 Tax=Bacillus cereus TaxID=1396 RepID=UPI000BFE70C4|nr:hypothetical protein [Bacillus cereus]PGP18669.1 hypothetical protein COA01_23285 [Bacillus cereus]
MQKWENMIAKVQRGELLLRSDKCDFYQNLTPFTTVEEFKPYRKELEEQHKSYFRFKRKQRAVAEYLLSLAQQSKGVAYPSRETIAKETNVSLGCVDDFIAYAKENMNMIVLPTFGAKKQRQSGQAHNVYIFVPKAISEPVLQTNEEPKEPEIAMTEDVSDDQDIKSFDSKDLYYYSIKNNNSITTDVADTHKSKLHIHSLVKANHFPRELVESLRGFSPQKVYHIVKRILGALNSIGAEFKAYSAIILKIVRKAVKMNPNEFKKNITSYVCFEVKRQIKAVMKWEENQVKEAEYHTEMENEEPISFEESQQQMFDIVKKAKERQRMEKINLWFSEFRKISSDFSSIQHVIEKVVLEFGILRNQASSLVYQAIGPISVMPTEEEMDEMPY